MTINNQRFLHNLQKSLALQRGEIIDRRHPDPDSP
jgi:hypothetical protein